METPSYWVTRILLQRSLGLIYLVAFLVAANQFRALCGQNGLLPVQNFLKHVRVIDAPSIFWINSSDAFIGFSAWLGVVLAILAVTGVSDSYGIIFSILVWFLLWILYMSFVNVGQTFYGFGWESLLLEAGFLTIFLGSKDTAPPVIVIWLFRWLLFRLMFGAGLIKIRGDACWRDFTCMRYHYETQPMPNPLSWYFHHLPLPVHKFEVLINHIVELFLPLLYFGHQLARYVAGVGTFAFQAMLILSGNFSWLNYLTLCLCIACFDDSFFSFLPLSFFGIRWISRSLDNYFHSLLRD